MSQSLKTLHTPHEATTTEAAIGFGTVHHSPRGLTLQHPILDGSTEHYPGEHLDPRFGMINPELVRHPRSGKVVRTPFEERGDPLLSRKRLHRFRFGRLSL